MTKPKSWPTQSELRTFPRNHCCRIGSSLEGQEGGIGKSYGPWMVVKKLPMEKMWAALCRWPLPTAHSPWKPEITDLKSHYERVMEKKNNIKCVPPQLYKPAHGITQKYTAWSSRKYVIMWLTVTKQRVLVLQLSQYSKEIPMYINEKPKLWKWFIQDSQLVKTQIPI